MHGLHAVAAEAGNALALHEGVVGRRLLLELAEAGAGHAGRLVPVHAVVLAGSVVGHGIPRVLFPLGAKWPRSLRGVKSARGPRGVRIGHGSGTDRSEDRRCCDPAVAGTGGADALNGAPRGGQADVLVGYDVKLARRPPRAVRRGAAGIADLRVCRSARFPAGTFRRSARRRRPNGSDDVRQDRPPQVVRDDDAIERGAARRGKGGRPPGHAA